MIKALKLYLPIWVIFLLVFAMSAAIHSAGGDFRWMSLANTSMGLFLCILSMFKLFDVPGFVDGFQMYDMIGKRLRLYAYAYPFIELSLGILFLSGFVPLTTNAVTLALMTISSIGVVRSVLGGMDVRCACLGTALNVPLSTVSIIENVSMGAMACVNLVSLLTR